MKNMRGTSWFLALAVVLAFWMAAICSFRGVAEAGMIASHGADAGDARSADLAKVRSFLEGKIVLQRLVDYGVSPEEAMSKVNSMSDSDLHRFASLTDRVAAGADGVGLAIGLAVLVILILVILMMMNKKVVIR